MTLMRIPLTVGLVVSVTLGVSPSAGYGATVTAASCSYADVSAAVLRAMPNDEVLVPACRAVWSAPLVLTRPIQLVGSGIGSTVISSGFTSSTRGIISVEPSPPSDGLYRVSGFTIDQNTTSYGVSLYNLSATAIRGLRIDHNSFTNVGALRAIFLHGTFYGVIDSNVFNLGAAGTALVTRGYLDDYPCTAWSVLPLAYGASTNIYFEDNAISGGDAPVGTGQAGRFVVRYNTYTSPTRNQVPLIDMHGNQPTVGCAGTVAEIYGNDLDFGSYGGYLFDHRGGRALVYYNIGRSQQYLRLGQVREEFADSLSGSLHKMHVQDSYYFGNSLNGSMARMEKTQDLTPPAVTENVDYFNQVSTFDGSSGVGCGPLELRPKQCTIGVGYWATDQSCSALGQMVGAGSAAPISGVLFTCSAANVWTSFYTPFTYPHPLRRGGPLPPYDVKIVR